MIMEIILYTLPTCKWCDKTKAWFKGKKIKFEERDLGESQNKLFRTEALEKSGQIAVPVTDIGGTIIVGYDEAAFEKALNK